ncbi:mechanosensitive ion channel family protein [Nitrospira sp. Kam-Ns4a]
MSLGPTLSPTLQKLVFAGAVFLAATAAALAVRALAFRGLHRWAASTETDADDLIVESLRLPSIAWVVLLGLYVAVTTADLPARYSGTALNLIYSLIVLSVTATLANLVGAGIRYGLRDTTLAVPATGLTMTFIKGAVWVVGGLVLLGGLGISITPVLTALGVGGLAVALALQETLSNLFAGLHLLIEKPIRVGDFVKLETGQEGYVADIGWRSTRIRMLPNNMVIIPNNKLAQSIVTNYYMPEQRMAVLIPISVSYASDPDRIERVLVEEASKAVGEIPGLLGDPAPFVRFIPGFGESSLDFTLICQVREFVDQYLVQHELRKRIFRRFKAEGIEIPFPQRDLHIRSSPGSSPPV